MNHVQRRYILRVLFVIALAICPGARSQSSAREIASTRDNWAKAMHSKQLDSVVNMYTADATFLTPDGGRFVGQAAIRELTSKAMEAFTSDITLRSLTTEFSGDLAYDSGEYDETLVLAGGGGCKKAAGDYLTVYKRQPDGKWLIQLQVWTEKTSEAHDDATAEVLKQITQYYADMTCSDGKMVPAFETHFWKGATITTVWQPSGHPKAEVLVTSVPDFVSQSPQGACSQPIFEEKTDSSEIKVHNGVAHVWAHYKARFGKPGAIQEWDGIDAFTLLQFENQWKIVSLAFRPSEAGPTTH